MKSIRVLTCAILACGLAASAATYNFEQAFDITVMGWYQGPTIISGAAEHERVIPVQMHSDNIVRSLAIDYGTNFYRGRLIYKSTLDGLTNKVVIRMPDKSELDVTKAFTFTPDVSVTDVVFRTNTVPFTTNSVVQTGLLQMSFTTTNLSFAANGFSVGTSTRSRRFVVPGTANVVYATLLNYTGGSGTFTLNTNKFATTNFTFSTNGPIVGGPGQIGFKTAGPVLIAD